jgi:hypothetical protein
MNDPENFLSRWARRKRDVAKGEVRPADREDAAADASIAAPKHSDTPAPDDKIQNEVAEQKTDEPAFDPASLPSLDSITAETDMRPFLARGVPASLRQAALRRVWAADPKIRDFIELAENQWDFNNGQAEILGFDFSAPTGDITRMIADIYAKKSESESEIEGKSNAPRSDESVPTVSTHREIAAHRNVTGTSSGDATTPAATELANETVRQTLVERHDEQDAASQKNDATQDSEFESRRSSHGRAMPK